MSKLTRRDFEIMAADEFLSGPDGTVERINNTRQCLITMESDCVQDEGCPEGMSFWQPFEDETVGHLLALIYNLADQFESIYKKGLEDGK